MFAAYSGNSVPRYGPLGWHGTLPTPPPVEILKEAQKVLSESPEVVADEVNSATIGDSTDVPESEQPKEAEAEVTFVSGKEDVVGSGTKRKSSTPGVRSTTRSGESELSTRSGGASSFDLDYLLYEIGKAAKSVQKKEKKTGEGLASKKPLMPEKMKSLRESVNAIVKLDRPPLRASQSTVSSVIPAARAKSQSSTPKLKQKPI